MPTHAWSELKRPHEWASSDHRNLILLHVMGLSWIGMSSLLSCSLRAVSLLRTLSFAPGPNIGCTTRTSKSLRNHAPGRQKNMTGPAALSKLSESGPRSQNLLENIRLARAVIPSQHDAHPLLRAIQSYDLHLLGLPDATAQRPDMPANRLRGVLLLASPLAQETKVCHLFFIGHLIQRLSPHDWQREMATGNLVLS